MSKLGNTLIMLKLLSTGRKYTVNELSEILEVTPRMIRIYKEDIEKAGIYIKTIMGPYGGYILEKNIKLPVQTFSQNDVIILDKCIKNCKTKKEKEQINILKEKIQGIYTKNKSLKYSLDKDELQKFNILNKTIKEKKKLKIKYYSFNKGETERIILPGEMFLFEDGWYVAAFCELRKDIRHFELKRIKEYIMI